MFVRIRPYDKRRGQLVRRYIYGGFRFEADHGWYEVDDAIADYLKTVLTFPEDPDSKPVFDVSDQAGAEKLAREEYEAANPERKIAEATAGRQKVTLGDLNLKGTAKEDKPKEPKEEASKSGGKKDKPAKDAEASGPPAKAKPAASGKSDSK